MMVTLTAMKKLSVLTVGAAVMALGTLSTQKAVAVTLDFESLAAPGNGITNHGFVYSEDGFTLTNTSQSYPFATFNTGESRFPGSTALFNDTINGITVLTKNDGGTFGLQSIKLSELNGSFSALVNFVGVKADSTTVSQTFSLDRIFGFETFAFQGFVDLVSVSWVQEPNFHQFDDIEIVDKAKSVPEPASVLGLLAVSALGAGSHMKRRQQQKAQARA
jgi:hypothetical protein